MKTHFTSDLHLGHKNIMKYCKRPWARDVLNPTPEETRKMDWELVVIWNQVVAPEDVVYNLGDVAFCTNEDHAHELLRAMNGIQHVVEGNHDRWADSRRKEPGIARRLSVKYPSLFASYIPGYLEERIEGQEIVMCHYAMRSWHHDIRGVWNLFGHTHASLEPYGKSVDVGIDNSHNIHPHAWYRPLSFAEVKAYMDTRPIGNHPGFENYDPGHPEIAHLQILGGSEHDNQRQDQAGPAVLIADQEEGEEDGGEEDI